MKKCIALILILILTLTAGSALAAGARVESVEYKGFGIVEIDFSRDCDWTESATIALADAGGAELPVQFVGGEADNCFLRCAALADGADCTLNFAMDGTEQSIPFAAVTGTEYKVFNDGTIREDVERERCDFCGEPGHDEDYCPERHDAGSLPDDPDELARMFDIDRCERCGGMGHDDDHCPNR